MPVCVWITGKPSLRWRLLVRGKLKLPFQRLGHGHPQLTLLCVRSGLTKGNSNVTHRVLVKAVTQLAYAFYIQCK